MFCNLFQSLLQSFSTENNLFRYRMSHETWQLVNGFECLLPYVKLDIKDLFQFISLTNSFTKLYFTLKSIFYKMTSMLYYLLFSFVSKNVTYYGRRHLKLFTNCHVSWDMSVYGGIDKKMEPPEEYRFQKSLTDFREL